MSAKRKAVEQKETKLTKEDEELIALKRRHESLVKELISNEREIRHLELARGMKPLPRVDDGRFGGGNRNAGKIVI